MLEGIGGRIGVRLKWSMPLPVERVVTRAGCDEVSRLVALDCGATGGDDGGRENHSDERQTCEKIMHERLYSLSAAGLSFLRRLQH